MDFEAIKNAMDKLEENIVYELLEAVMADGGKNVHNALAACQEGMTCVGDRFESGEYFLGDLMMAGAILTNAMKIIAPALGGESGINTGQLILCTVKNDLHDIGKNIVKTMMEASGFEVLDLGIDTPPDKVVAAAKESGFSIIALSGVLTLALDSMKDTVEAFKREGMRESVKIIIGGNPVTEDACKAIGADAWAHSPQKGIDICRSWAVAE